MIRCSNCGADNRDNARFCKACGAKLLLPIVPKGPTVIGPPGPVGPPAPAGSPAPIRGPSPGSAHAPAFPIGAPVGFPRTWKAPQPVVEGPVVHMDAPVQEKAPMGGRLLIAAALALIKPVLALFVPSIMPATITVRYMRVQDHQTGRQRSVKMRGDPQGIINVGDWLAVWGKEEGGNIMLKAAYNYSTDAEIRPK